MTLTNGQTADVDEVLRVTKIDQIYTGAAYDSTGTEATYEMTAVASTDLTGNANYAVVKFTGTATSGDAGGTGGVVQVKAQVKETGQSYADIIAYKTMHQKVGTAGTTNILSTDYTVVATLTAGMKTNGFQIKLFSQVLTNAGSWTNIQTTLEVKP